MPRIKESFSAVIEFDDAREYADFIDLMKRLSKEDIAFYEGSLQITPKDVNTAISIMDELED